MKKLLLLTLILLISGCATIPTLHNIDNRYQVSRLKDNGIVFGKLSAEGTLYAKNVTRILLRVVNISNETNKYHLFFGDPNGQLRLPWNMKPIDPSYFFIELPPGTYKIYSLWAAVGGAFYEEEVDISFEATQGAVTYIGTLEANGLGERLKLGGFPLMQPGFYYECVVKDEKDEAIKEYEQNFSHIGQKLKINIMKVNLKTNKK